MRTTRVTDQERIYDYVAENPRASNTEISDDLRIPYNSTRVQIQKLKNKGLINVLYDERNERVIEITKESPVQLDTKPRTYKQEVYVELVEGYREDFRECVTFEEKLKVGREIRIILADM